MPRVLLQLALALSALCVPIARAALSVSGSSSGSSSSSLPIVDTTSTDATGVAGSLVAVTPYADAYPFTADQISAAMGSGSVALPGSLPGQSLSYLESGKRKLNAQQVSARLDDFQDFWSSTYPTIPLADFQAWAMPLYKVLVTQLKLSNKPHFKNKQQSTLRSMLLGLNLVGRQVNGGELNHFALLDPSETVYFTGLAARVAGSQQERRRALATPEMTEAEARRVLQTLPTSYDMRSSGLMPPIRDQMQCGACWAFTATSTLELQNIFLNGNPDSGELSEQMLVSCNTQGADQNDGCNGGWPEYANDFIASSGGLPTAATYPYTKYTTSSVSTPACNQALTSPKVVTSTPTTVYMPSTSPTSPTAAVLAAETAIMQAVYSGYPVTVTVAASSNCFQSYLPSPSASPSAQMMTCSCGSTIDHVILIVGYTAEYFIARNQWGTSWGLKGYAYMPRPSANSATPKTGQCMMLSEPSYVQTVIQLSDATSAPVATTASPTSKPVTTHAPAATTATPTSKPGTTKATSTPTHKPATSKSPTPMPTASNSGSCQSASNPLHCTISGYPKFCCPWLCYTQDGQQLCTNYVCCTNGVCAKLKFDSNNNPVVYCPATKRHRGLLAFLDRVDDKAERIEGTDVLGIGHQ